MSTETTQAQQSCNNCGRPIPAETKFCPYCRTEQFQDSPSAPSDHVEVMRASQDIWHFEEPELLLKNGQRPMVIVDETVIHLSQTQKQLSMDELLSRVQNRIGEQEVPVKVLLENMRWQHDANETRPRIVAFLNKKHQSDLRMMLGVDYLGSWASIQINIAMQPERLPRKHFKHHVSNIWIVISLIAVAISSILVYANPFFYYHSIYQLMLFVSVLWLIATAAFFRNKVDNEREQWEIEIQELRLSKTKERIFRTFRVDDARLFAAAMSEVFQSVVDDIIIKEGARLERIEGSNAGFLNVDGLTKYIPVERSAKADEIGL
jgi:hypothetical protein